MDRIGAYLNRTSGRVLTAGGGGVVFELYRMERSKPSAQQFCPQGEGRTFLAVAQAPVMPAAQSRRGALHRALTALRRSTPSNSLQSKEQVRALRPAERPGEARYVGLDPMGDLAAVKHPDDRSSRRALDVGAKVSAVWDQIPLAASMQMPSGPMPSAQVRRPDSEPSCPMSKADSLPAKDLATTSVDPLGVTAMPLGNSMPSVTSRVVPSGVTRRIHPAVGSPPPAKSNRRGRPGRR